jgi:hypothetical protein
MNIAVIRIHEFTSFHDGMEELIEQAEDLHNCGDGDVNIQPYLKQMKEDLRAFHWLVTHDRTLEI